MIKRWKECSVKYHDGVTADAAYAANMKLEDRKRLAEYQKQSAAELLERNTAVNIAYGLYDVEIHTSTQTCSHHNTKPVLLDAVVVPITESSTANHERLLLEAREERDNALLVARQCRDLVETAQAEKGDVKYKLEKRVEVV